MQMFHIQRLLLAALGLFMLTRTSDAVAQTLPPLQGIVDVAGGRDSTCALTSSSGVKCWGANGYGQLGDGSLVGSSLPVGVAGLASGVVGLSMDADGLFACALTSAGSAKCWGENWSGQLGDGTTVNRSTPVTVSGLASGVVEISVGGSHACALTSVGGVKCWGQNFYGQLGDGTTTIRFTPVDVPGLASGVIAIGTGAYHSCAVLTNGAVKCWGFNSQGQLGDGTTTLSRLAPVDVVGLSSGVVAVVGGAYHSCARTSSGSAKCWGHNGDAQIGDGTYVQRTVPVDVVGLAGNVISIHAAGYYSCALTIGDGLKCWGYNSGQMGSGLAGSSHSTPTVVSPFVDGASKLGVGQEHLCVVTTTGRIRCAGNDADGQLGDGAQSRRLTPVDVPGVTSNVAVVRNGGSFTCAVTSNGGAKCWGDNRFGQLGDNTTTRRTSAVDVTGLASGVVTVATGNDHACALTSSGGVKCWGDGGSGELGDGTLNSRLVPVEVIGLLGGVSAIAAGGAHTCALTTAGGVKCWGSNSVGQLGDGTIITRSTPTDVLGLTSGVIAISTGWVHTCALTIVNGIKCWGHNHTGQLGNGTLNSSLVPIDVVGLSSGIISIQSGNSHNCAVTSTGGVKCWGYNGSGSLGDGTWTSRLTPVDVSSLTSGVVSLGVGASHTCAVTSAGAAKCWGHGLQGQLGDGTSLNRYVPVGVSGLTSGAAMLSSGREHTCAVTSAGGLQCWGDNLAGQLGIGGRDFTLFADVLAGNSIFANGFD